MFPSDMMVCSTNDINLSHGAGSKHWAVSDAMARDIELGGHCTPIVDRLIDINPRDGLDGAAEAPGVYPVVSIRHLNRAGRAGYVHLGLFGTLGHLNSDLSRTGVAHLFAFSLVRRTT